MLPVEGSTVNDCRWDILEVLCTSTDSVPVFDADHAAEYSRYSGISYTLCVLQVCGGSVVEILSVLAVFRGYVLWILPVRTLPLYTGSIPSVSTAHTARNRSTKRV